MGQLSELQDSDPETFKSVTTEVAQKLQAAAEDARASGDTRKAEALEGMAEKFEAASESGEMPELGPPEGGRMQGPPPGPPPSGAPPASGQEEETSADAIFGVTGTSNSVIAAYLQNDGTDPMSALSGILEQVLSASE